MALQVTVPAVFVAEAVTLVMGVYCVKGPMVAGLIVIGGQPTLIV